MSFDSGVLIHGGVDVAGVDAAYRASMDLRNRVVNNVRYRCELGYRLHKQYANMNQQQQQGCYGVDGMPLPMPMISANLNVYIPPPPQQQDVYAQGYAAMGAGTAYQMPQQQFAPPIQQHHQQQQQYPQHQQQRQHPQQQQMPRQGQVASAPSYNQQENAPAPAPAAYPSAYSLASYSFSPTAMVSSILGSNRSPTAYELHQLHQLQTHSAMCTPHSTPRNVSVPAQGHQGQYGYSYRMPMNATSLFIQQQQQQQQQQHVPVTPMYSQQHQGQYISPPYQFQYYPSSANSTPTNARHDGNLRTRSMSTDAGSYSAASMMMPMPTVVVMPMQPSQQQQAYNQNYSSAPQQQQYLNSPAQGQQGGSLTPGKAYSPSTPRGSCSEYFAATKGLDLSINTMPPSMHPAYDMTAAVLQGSAENTPKSIYTTRKTTPGARRQMYDMRQADFRQQQLQNQHQVQVQVHMDSNAGPQNMQQQQAGKAPSRRNSNESIGTTSLFLGGSGEDSVPEVRSSIETDVGTMNHPHVGVEGQVN